MCDLWKQTKKGLFIINAWITIYRQSCMHDQITCMRSDRFWLANFLERVNRLAKFGGAGQANKALYEIQSGLYWLLIKLF